MYTYETCTPGKKGIFLECQGRQVRLASTHGPPAAVYMIMKMALIQYAGKCLPGVEPLSSPR